MTFKLPRLFSFLLIFNYALTFSVFSQTQSQVDYPKNRVIVKFKNNLSANALNDLHTAMGVQKSKPLGLIGAEVWELTGPTADETIASLKSNPNVEYIEPDYTLYAVAPVSAAADSVQVFPNDPRFPEMWGLHNTGQSGGTPDVDIDAPEAWAVTTGKEIVVGVIDSGTDWLHEDLADNIWINQGEIPDNGIDDDNNGYVDDVRGWDFFDNDNNPQDPAGHGTHVAGTIAAVGNNKIGTVGVNWAAKIMILRFLGPNGSGSTSDAIMAIEYAVKMKARLTNNSWGGTQFNQALKDAIEAAGNAGQLFVAAAGNSGQNSDLIPHYPASYDLDNIISVANLTCFNRLSTTSTFGVATVDLAAPGSSILSTFPGNTYGSISGTSMATPHVTGTVSLVLSINPSLPALEVKNLILSTVDSVGALQGLVASGGRLNAHQAVLSADPDSIPPAPVTDLTAGEPTSNSITARWTASGDDSTEGTAGSYDMRYSENPIDTSNFAAATKVQNSPAPQESGRSESVTIEGLDFSTTYFIALKVLDNAGNASEISNLASAATLGAPNIVVSEDSLSQVLLAGATATQNFKIKNDAEGTLDFDIGIESVSGSNAITSIQILPQTSNAQLSPWRWAEHRARYELTKNAPVSRDRLVADLPKVSQRRLEWYKRFESAVADSFIIFMDDMESGENGWSHSATSGAIDFWAQTNTRSRSGATSWHVSQHISEGAEALQSPSIDLTPYETAMLSFHHWYQFDDCGDPTFDPDGGIVEISMDGGVSWRQIFPVGGYPNTLDVTCGNPLEARAAFAHASGDGVNFIPAFFDLSSFVGNVVHLRFHAGWDCGNCSADNEGWYIDDVTVYSQNFVSWLSASPGSGTVVAGDSVEITVIFDAFDLNAGGFDARINMISNDPDDSTVSIPVHLDVIGAPDIFTKIDTLDFGGIFTGQQDTLGLQVENRGADILEISEITAQPSAFSVTPNSGSLAPGDVLNLSIIFAPVNTGMIGGSLIVSSNDPDEAIFTVALRGEGVPPPVIAVSPDSLSEQLLTGGMSKQILTMANNGGSDLNFTLEVELSDSASTSVFLRSPSYKNRLSAIERYQKENAGMYFFDNGSEILPVDNPGGAWPGTITPAAVGIPFHDGFEDGDFADWLIDDTTGVRVVTSETSARGRFSFTYRNIIQGHFHGIHQEFEPSQPGYISFFVRSGSTTQSDAYFLITANGNRRNSVILFFARGSGFFFANGSTPGGDETFQYNANQWYHIEFKDIDWTEKHFAYYVDGNLIKTDIPFRNAALVNDIDKVFIYNFAANAQAWWDDINIGDPGVLWLDANPLVGTVSANSQLGIDVLYNAIGLAGGDYHALIKIAGNDPVTPNVQVPVLLQVTEAPDITLSADSLDYGVVFTGVNISLPLVVSNIGTDTLEVTDIAANHGDFTANPASFTLAPAGKQTVNVILTASAPGAISATLAISSNDPDEAEVQIHLSATALIPPIIAVAPDSLSQVLFTGGNATQKLTISNENADGDMLDFTISVAGKDSAAIAKSVRYYVQSRYTQNGKMPDSDWQDAQQPLEIMSWGKHPARNTEATNIFTKDYSAASTPLLPIVVADSIGDGGPVVDVTVLRGASISDSLHIQIDFSTKVDPSNFGGALSLDTDQNPATGMPPFSGLPGQDIGADYEFIFFNLASGVVDLFDTNNLIGSYPVKISDKSLRFATPLRDLGNDDGMMDVTGVLGTSAGPTDWFPEAGHGTITTGVSWLSAAPISGNVPGGASLEITIMFDATGLFGGDYFADIAFASNDPVTPILDVLAHLTVIDASDISVSKDSINFGEVFIGFTKQDSFIVTNNGTIGLQVDNIDFDNPEFSAGLTRFSVEPGKSQTVHTVFAPQLPQSSTGILRLTSNDPDEPVVEIALSGEGKIPPDISVDPPSLNLFVNPDDSTIVTLEIINSGGSDLTYMIHDEEENQPTILAGDASLFWSVTSSTGVDTLNRSDLDGNNPEVFTLGSGLMGVAIDTETKTVYWANTGDGTIRASDLDGSNERTIIRGLITPVEITLDIENGKIYWADFNADNIGRANLNSTDQEIIISGAISTGSTAFSSVSNVGPKDEPDGSDVPGIQTQFVNSPWGIALDLANQKLYWTEQNDDQIGWANLDGSEAAIILDSTDVVNGPRGIAVDPAIGKIFWVDSFDNEIMCANLDGDSLRVVLTLPSTDNALAIDLDTEEQQFYWSDNITDHISRAKYDGSEVKTIIQTNVPNFNGPVAVALFLDSGWLFEAPTAGVVVAGETDTITVKVDATGLEEGEYKATIFVESNDPDDARVEIPVSLRVNKAQVVLSIPDTLQTLPGDTLDIPVSIVLLDSSLEITAFGAAMKATGEVLTFLGHTSGPILSGRSLSLTNPSPDSVRMGFLALNQAPLAQSGLLVTLHFQVDVAASGGEHSLKLSDISAGAPSGQAIPAASLNGKVTIITHSIAGTVLYCEQGDAGNPEKPVPDLEVALINASNVLQDVKTSLSGEYNVSNIRPGFDYRIEVGRQAGGTGAALTPTDALLVVHAFLGTTTFSGCQNLAADADGNRTVNPVDAGLIFNRFLGRIAQFPVADWRTYPSNYDIDAPSDAWKNVPGGKDYPKLQQSLSEQDFLAVAIGDVDLSWPDAAPGSSANLLAKGNGESASLRLQVAETELSPITNEATVQIYLDGPALASGVFAFGGELQYDATALEILSVRWGEVVPKEGFRTDFRTLAALPAVDKIENESKKRETADGRLRFGGFSTSQAKIKTAGVLLEVDVSLVGEHDPGTVLLLELRDCSAVFGNKNTSSANRNTGAAGAITSFTNANVSATGGAVAVSALPKSFALEENYPNPFNPTTRIRYQLPEAAKVKIEIYNTLGHKILTLVGSDAQKAGFYAIDWHGRDAAGRAVASGVYLYRIEADSENRSFTKTRKMLLIK